MVTRSTTGTGVVVSLVVFVLCTVFLLMLTIVFYTGQTKAVEERREADTTLARKRQIVSDPQTKASLFMSLAPVKACY